MIGATVAVCTVAVAVQLFVVASLLRSHADITRATNALLGPGPTPAPPPDGLGPSTGPRAGALELTGVDRHGDVAVLSLRNGRPFVLLAFLSSSCLTCRGVWQALAAEPLDLPDDVEVVALAKDAVGTTAGVVTALVAPDAWPAFAVPGEPYFVLVDATAGSIVGEGAASSWSHVCTLVGRWLPTRRPARPPALTRRSTVERLEDVDAVLHEAGIGPGHPSLGPPR